MPLSRLPLPAPIAATLALLAGLAAWAEPAPPATAPGIRLVEYGIYCRPQVTGREAAPDTTLGYINVYDGEVAFRHRGQVVPAVLGLSFGLVITSDADHLEARMETWRPDKAEPDIWFTDIRAGANKTRGFSFDFENELIPGPWRMEAWDGEERLYSIDFQVVAPSELPGVDANCNLMS